MDRGLITRHMDEDNANRHYVICSFWNNPRETCNFCNGYFRRMHAEAIRLSTPYNRR